MEVKIQNADQRNKKLERHMTGNIKIDVGMRVFLKSDLRKIAFDPLKSDSSAVKS